jgi:NADP-dependent 3-hydroxy acid dehydrogenase YdfG
MSADLRSGGSSIYAATKSGIQAFAEALRKEVNPRESKVSLIEPGKTGSDMVEESPSEQRNLIHKHDMLRAEDIAVAVHYVLTQPARRDIVSLQIRPHLQLDLRSSRVLSTDFADLQRLETGSARFARQAAG